MSLRRGSRSGVISLSSIRIIPEGKGLKTKTLIAGFHGIGATGYWSVKFLIEELKAKRAASTSTRSSPPRSRRRSTSIISTPYELFVAGDLALLKADVPPLRENENKFFRELGQWIVESGVHEVALIGGLDDSLRGDDSKYRVVLTDAMAKLEELKDEPVLEEGRMIVGPVAHPPQHAADARHPRLRAPGLLEHREGRPEGLRQRRSSSWRNATGSRSAPRP